MAASVTTAKARAERSDQDVMANEGEKVKKEEGLTDPELSIAYSIDFIYLRQ